MEREGGDVIRVSTNGSMDEERGVRANCISRVGMTRGVRAWGRWRRCGVERLWGWGGLAATLGRKASIP